MAARRWCGLDGGWRRAAVLPGVDGVAQVRRGGGAWVLRVECYLADIVKA